MRKNTPERVMKLLKEKTFFEPISGCWIYQGPDATSNKEHCRVKFNNKMIYVHRLSAHLHWGFDLDSSMLILHDAFCVSPKCWNPQHLREGTQQENMQDSVLVGTFKNVIAEERKQATHCKWGHEFTPENTRIRPGGRECKECQRERDRERYAVRKMPILQQ